MKLKDLLKVLDKSPANQDTIDIQHLLEAFHLSACSCDRKLHSTFADTSLDLIKYYWISKYFSIDAYYGVRAIYFKNKFMGLMYQNYRYTDPNPKVTPITFEFQFSPEFLEFRSYLESLCEKPPVVIKNLLEEEF